MTSTSPLTVPPGWHSRADPAPDVLVAARGAPSSAGVPPELVLRRAEVPSELAGDLRRWRAAAVADLGRLLDRFALEDTEVVDLDGHDVLYQRFAHRGIGADLVTEQWSWLVGGCGLTLSATVALEDYADLCDVVEEAACSVEPAALRGRPSRHGERAGGPTPHDVGPPAVVLSSRRGTGGTAA